MEKIFNQKHWIMILGLKKSLKSILLITLFIAVHAWMNAQSVFKVNGNPYVGYPMVFVFSGSSSSISWSAPGASSVVPNGNQVTITYSSPKTNAYVSAYVSSCSGCNPGTYTSSTFNVTYIPPTTPTTPTVVNYCGYSDLTATAPPAGVTWYWQTSSSGTNTANSALTNRVTSSGTYYLRARNNTTQAWSTSSASLAVTVNSLPTVSISPSNPQSIYAGSNLTFNAVTANAINPTYVWKVNGQVQSGQTGASFSSTAFTNGQIVTVEMTSQGSCNSNNPFSASTPPITVNQCLPPESTTETICVGGTRALDAVSAGQGITGHRWYDAGGNPITSNITTLYAGIPYVTQYANPNSYYQTTIFQVSSMCGSFESSKATITVNVGQVTPPYVTISSNPAINGADAGGARLTICSGTSVSLTAVPISHGSNPTYQWRKNGSLVATGITYNPSWVVNGDRFTVEMTSTPSCSSTLTVSSDVLNLTVNPILTPSVKISPLNPEVSVGRNLTFTATPTHATNPSYVWKVDGQVQNGQTGNTFSLLTQTNGQTVTVEITSHGPCDTNNFASASSSISTYKCSPPESTSTPICRGETRVIDAIAIGEHISRLKWYTSGGNPIESNITTPYVGIPFVSQYSNPDAYSQTTIYLVSTVCNDEFETIKVPITVNVIQPVPVYVAITSDPPITGGGANGPTLTLCKGNQLVLSASTASYTNQPSFQWKKNGEIIYGATGQTYSPTSVNPGDYFSLQMTADNTCVSNATVSSENINIGIYSIDPPEAPAIVLPNDNSSPITLIAQGAGANDIYRFYTKPTGGFYLSSNTIPAIQEPAYYYVSIYSNQYKCETARTQLKVTPKKFHQNFIRTTTPITGSVNLPDLNTSKMNFQYFDGLGRPMQTVEKKGSFSEKDIVQIIDYDEYGREKVKYMPFTTINDGGFTELNEAIFKYDEFYNSFFPGEDHKFTAITEFEPSPLNRPIKQGAPGKDWQIEGGHPVTMDYGTNETAIFKYSVTGNDLTNSVTKSTETYPIGSLFVNTVTNEDGKSSKEYKNTLGQVVLTEMQGGFKTYSVYDDFGLLRCVIPPEANGEVNPDYCFFYKYDERHRLIEKQIPGSNPVYMVYDYKDRLVMSQDPNLHSINQWNLIQYNDLNWVVATGIYTDTHSPIRSRVEIQGDYTEDFAESDDFKALTRTFYSEYPASFETDFPFNNAYNISGGNNTKIKGLVTYSETRILDTDDWLTTVNYYDSEYRVIQTTGENHLGGLDIISNKYDFMGQLLETKQEQSTPFASHSISKRYTYDHAGRLLKTEMDFDNTGFKTTSENVYNELGQVIEKKIHQNTAGDYLIRLQENFNIRGWMNSMNYINKNNAQLFKLDLMYNINTISGNKIYNGNISAMKWNSMWLNGERSYGFNYDGLERLLTANYTGISGEDYTTSYSYDGNGNIKTLTRNGLDGTGYTEIDKLEFGYKGNQLIKVNDKSTSDHAKTLGFTEIGLDNEPDVNDPNTWEYEYDLNGNMTADHNKQIGEVQYNYLNLPKSIDMDNGTPGNWIKYTYDAAGIKLQQEVTQGGTIQKVTDYIGNFVYEDEELAYILTNEGRMVANSQTLGSFDYEYFIKDHLGNTRMVIKDKNNNGVTEVDDIIQENHYDPFGMILKGQSYQLEANKYLYNGKELQTELGLDWYDYGARYYDPAIARWMSVDPLAEKYPHESPYNYCYNNPIKFIDPTGMEGDGWIRDDEDYVYWDEYTNSEDNFYTNYLMAGLTDYEYIGQEFWGIDSEGNLGYGDNEGHYSFLLGESLISAEAPYKSGIAYAMFGELASGKLDAGPYGPATEIPIPTPDYAALSLSGTAILGGGGGADLNIVYVKGDGIAVNGGFRAGSGLDISANVSITIGNYSGKDKPTIVSTSGANTYENINYGPLSFTTQQDVSSNKYGKLRFGKNWNYGSIGLGVGLKDFPIITGSAGTSMTSKPWFYLYKSK
jgi:RHS repeat-associated protein